MKPPRFEYFEPESVDEAIGLLARHGGEATVLAGGQSLVPMLNFRLARPAVLVDLNRIPALAYVQEQDGGLVLGAMTRQREVERSALVRARCPLLFEAIRLIGHPQIRARGTIGGSLAHADPAAELPAVVTGLGGTLVARGPSGRRELKPSEFFHGYLTHGLAPGELLVEIRLPALPPRTGTAFLEVSRRHGDFALVGVAVTVTLDAADRCERASLVFTGVGPVPAVAAGAARVLIGEPLSDRLLDAAADAVERELHPDSDLHASATYRRQVGAVLARRALASARERAQRARG